MRLDWTGYVTSRHSLALSLKEQVRFKTFHCFKLFDLSSIKGMPFARLRKQHRMRPEISVMMRPIYDDLLDHDSVRNKKNIKGINKNIFFIDHVVKEVKT